ncbi:WbqC family protein [Fusobacterium hwasookii]|nr:WbqC family protein [Fusobacterium hwasookii]
MKYNYPEYSQINGEFNHFVTILDVLFNMGKETINYIFTGDIEEI